MLTMHTDEEKAGGGCGAWGLGGGEGWGGWWAEGKGERGKGRVVRVVVEEAGVLIWPIQKKIGKPTLLTEYAWTEEKDG